MTTPNQKPLYALVPNLACIECSSAYTDRTCAAAGLVELITAGTAGTKITEIGYKAQGTTVAATLFIVRTDADGSNKKLIDEIMVSAVTPSNTVPSGTGSKTYSDFQLKAGQKIYVGITAFSGTDRINVYCKLGDY